MNKEQELRPCPFCGGSAQWADRACNIARVKCTACGASVYGPESRNYDAASSSAIAAWNRRSSDEQAEVVGYVDRLNEPTRISPTEQPGLEMPVFASPPAVAAGGVTVDPDLLAKQSAIEPDVAAVVYADRSKLYSDFSGGVTADMVESACAGFEHGVTQQTQDYQFKQLGDGWLFRSGDWINVSDALRAALLAALAVRDEGIREGWQPIETAPKDGTEVLLWGVCWRDHQAYAPDRNVGWWAGDHLGWQTRGQDEDIDPTHWRPLPTPPSRGEGV